MGFECKIKQDGKPCTRTFASQQALKQHRLDKHKHQDFSCDQCDKTFKSSQAMQQHKAEKDGGPHDKERCQACRLGVCDRDAAFQIDLSSD